MAIGQNDVIRASVVWDLLAVSTQVNALHFQVGGIVAQTPLQIREDLEDILALAYVTITPMVSNLLEHLRTDIFNVTDNVPETGLAGNTAMNGSNAGEILPNQVTGEVYFRTGVSRHIGRIFLPTFGEGQSAADVWNSTTRSAMQTFGDYLLSTRTGTNGVTFTYVIYDRSAGIGRQPIQAVVPLRSRTQRRRRVGVGI